MQASTATATTAPALPPITPPTAVRPISPVAPYIGGKRLLAKRLVERINAIPHTCYAEPFVGMGGVFFKRDHAAKSEVINDLSGDVATLFRVLQRHYVPFVEFMRYQLTSRAEFERLIKTDPETLTDIERAARFVYLQRVTFGSRVTGRAYRVTRTAPASFDIAKVAPLIEAAYERLTRVVIERLPFQNFIPRYDTPQTLFYLDPPYYGVEDYYGKDMFSRDDFTRLADILAAIKGRFLMSINDRPEVREIFSAFKIDPVTLRYTVNGPNRKNCIGKELIISNGVPDA